jgi:hypothetical protein
MSGRAQPVVLLVLAAAIAAPLALGSPASAPPVGPLPKGPVTTINVPAGQLFAFALPRRTAASGLVWRSASSVGVPRVVKPLREADVGGAVVMVYKAVAPGRATVRFGLTKGETVKAYASATYRVTVVPHA